MSSNAPKDPEESSAFDRPENSGKPQANTPYDRVIEQVVTKVNDELLLFVIALTALLIGLVVLATGLGSSDLRFVIVVIAVLAVTVIIGYYVVAVLKVQAKSQKPSHRVEPKPLVNHPQRSADSPIGEEKSVPSSPSVIAFGPGSIAANGNVSDNIIIDGNNNIVQKDQTAASSDQLSSPHTEK